MHNISGMNMAFISNLKIKRWHNFSALQKVLLTPPCFVPISHENNNKKRVTCVLEAEFLSIPKMVTLLD